MLQAISTLPLNAITFSFLLLSLLTVIYLAIAAKSPYIDRNQSRADILKLVMASFGIISAIKLCILVIAPPTDIQKHLNEIAIPLTIAAIYLAHTSFESIYDVIWVNAKKVVKPDVD